MTHRYTVTAVLVYEDTVIEYLTINGEQLETTPEHPFYTEQRDWVDAGDLWIVAYVRKATGSAGMVEAIGWRLRSQSMHNLSVDEAHTPLDYRLYGWWFVHSDDGVPRIRHLERPPRN